MAVMNSNDEYKFEIVYQETLVKMFAKLFFILFQGPSGMSCVASNKVESPTAKVEGHRPWTTANLNPCVQIEKIRKFRLLIQNCRQQRDQLNLY